MRIEEERGSEMILLTKEPGFDAEVNDKLQFNMLLFMLINDIRFDFRIQEDKPIEGKAVVIYNHYSNKYYLLNPQDVSDFWDNKTVHLATIDDKYGQYKKMFS